MTIRRALIGIIAASLFCGSHVPMNAADRDSSDLFARKNLVAWCIVPFDSKKRGPEERAAMLEKLGFSHFAYDYRAEHIPTFDEELESLKRHQIELSAWWFPTSLNEEAKMTLELFAKHKVTPQLWVTGGGEPTKSSTEQQQRVRDEAARIRPIAEAGAKIGCRVALYNHGGWFGEPENQIEIIRELNLPNVGIVYNQHHGHDHIARFPELLAKMKPYLFTLNLNGMVKDGDRKGQKILQLGQGDQDLALMKIIRESGYRGPIGILGHTSDDAEERLADNLDGLDWLLPQLEGKQASPQPKMRTPIPVAQEPAAANVNTNVPRVTEGKFGKAIDGRTGGVFVAGRDAFRNFPITVECWTKLNDKTPYNILVAHETKSSGTHWELFSMAGTGNFTVYTPGFAPDHCHSKSMICDGQWHHVAMILEKERIRLFVDGQIVASQAHQRTDMKTAPGNLSFATLADQQFGCSGLVDEIRISRSVRPLDSIPQKPHDVDESTLGLWHLDELIDQNRFEDATKNSPALIKLASKEAAPSGKRPKIEGHWGEEALGFRWTEEDSRDNRFGQMDTGPFFSGSITGPGGIVFKGIVVRLGDKRTASICYDTELIRASAGWTGFLQFDAARFGIIVPPKIAGDVTFTNPLLAGWTRTDQFFNFRETSRYGMLPKTQAHYEGLYRHGQRVVLKFTVGTETLPDQSESRGGPSTSILESPWQEERDGIQAISRTLLIGPSTTPLSTLVAEGNARVRLVTGHQAASLRPGPNNGQILVIPPHSTPVSVKLLIASSTIDEAAFDRLAAGSAPAEDLMSLVKPGPSIWGDPLVTVGEVDKGRAAFAVDTFTLPFENPFRALMFCGGHDLLPDGRAFVSTLHGDVWLVGGLDDTLKRITWRRFATGLFQPLGVKLVPSSKPNDQQSYGMDLYVVGRDQITRLHDFNGDGEADFYENFNNDAYVSLNGHEYVTCLETDKAGNFYYVKGNCNSAIPHDGSLLRVSADGSKLDVFATGFRNANGIGIGPNDEITVAPQEGEWTPASAVFAVRQGGFYGGTMSHHLPTTPTDFERPFCWFPRLADNSCGGQVWIPPNHWGPLAGHLLHLSYGQCKLRLLFREEFAEQKNGVLTHFDGQLRSPLVTMNGGSTELPMTFGSGIHRGRFGKKDGHLYLTGLKGWVTSAVNDGCFQRVRYQGETSDILVDMKTYANGVALTFTRPLNRDQVENIDNYQIETWNYHWSAAYGSPDLRLSAPGQVGRDPIEPKSVSLLKDNRTVFIEIPNLKPADQLGVTYSLTSAEGTAFEQTAYLTLNAVPKTIFPEADIHRSTSDIARLALLERLSPGVLVSTNLSQSSTVRRMMAWPALGTDDSACKINAIGYLKVPSTGEYLISGVMRGLASLEINGREHQLTSQPAKVRLIKGLNRVRFQQNSTAKDSQFRLMWESDRFPKESIPASAWFHEKTVNDESAKQKRILEGQILFARYGCRNCHTVDPKQASWILAGMDVEQIRQAPLLKGIGGRTNARWLDNWLRNPTSLRPDSTMPCFTALEDDEKRADMVAYLATFQERTENQPESSQTKTAESVPVGSDIGASLYERFGCIACHTFAASDANAEWNRVSLQFVAAKYRPGELSRYLRNPLKHHVGSHMPDFHLDENEANALTGDIAANSKGVLEPPKTTNVGSAERGKKLFVELRCSNCHRVDTEDKLWPANAPNAFAAQSGKGCVSMNSTDRGKAPIFKWTNEEFESIRAFLSNAGKPAPNDAPTIRDDVPRLLTTLRCTACHARDGSSAAWPEIVTEEGSGRLTEIVPQLTWVGEKLQGPWIERFIAGDLKDKPRPWITARMPSFPAYAKIIAHGFADEHGVPFAEAIANQFDASKSEIGHQLTLQNGGLDCRQCHGLGKEKPRGDTATQIALGINFAMTKDRLRAEFVLRQLLDPPRYDSSSRMPRFAPDLRTTAAKHIEAGDARKQFDAIQHYLWSVKTDE